MNRITYKFVRSANGDYLLRTDDPILETNSDVLRRTEDLPDPLTDLLKALLYWMAPVVALPLTVLSYLR
jgi:hypothetical protein